MRRHLLTAIVTVVAGSTALGGSAIAAPTGIVVTPVVASTGASVTVSGGGCTADVHVTATGFLFPGSPSVVADQTVAPALDGAWDVTFPMPPAPSYVLAECDGTTSAPVVIAPRDIPAGYLSPQSVTATDVVISTSPLVNGSTFAVFDFAGTLVASDTVASGVGTVVVPRSLGEPSLLALALRQQDPGIQLPYVPLALRVEMPLASASTIDVSPPVAESGEVVVVSGTCSAAPRLVVSGRVLGWYDPAPIYLDVVPSLDSTGAWSTILPMPVLPSIARLTCTGATVADVVAMQISPSAGDLPSVTPTVSGDLITVAVPSTAFPYTLRAYTSEGEGIALSITNEAGGLVGRMESAARPVRILLIGTESLGENAEAFQNTRVQAWTVDVAGTPPVPTDTFAPSSPPLPDTAASESAQGAAGSWLAALALPILLAGLLAAAVRAHWRS